MTSLMSLFVLLQSSYFLHKIHSIALPCGEMVLGGNEKS